MLGNIHSIESMGLVDGPGVRSVVFMQGCLLRCKYCHNPDTWDLCKASKQMSPNELANKLLRFREYYGENGGVTLSGGEPLLQLDFATELFTLLKEQNIHTCLDTSGVGDVDEPNYRERLSELLKVTDLVLLDIKHYENESYRRITGRTMDAYNVFLSELQRTSIPVWIRHVVVPNLTDGKAHIVGLREYISTIKNVQNVKLLPYHTLGIEKYKTMGIPYSLEGVPPMTKELTAVLEKILRGEMNYAD